jgi:hypothetical protein
MFSVQGLKLMMIRFRNRLDPKLVKFRSTCSCVSTDSVEAFGDFEIAIARVHLRPPFFNFHEKTQRRYYWAYECGIINRLNAPGG